MAKWLEKTLGEVTAFIAKGIPPKYTEEEKAEQAELRKEYIAAVKGNLKAQLNNIRIKESDGSVTNLGEKYGNKKVH